MSEKTSSVRDGVKEFYGKAAVKPAEMLCCPVSYTAEDISHIPEDAVEVSYGCGSPIAAADLKAGETVLDLGSGGGIDCFIAAKKVGKDGRVVGVDMTDEMLDKANVANETVASKLGYKNVEFKKGFLEDVPVEDSTVDCVVSNCVINLSHDKGKVLREVVRVLKPGGRLCVADVVAEKDVPQKMQDDKTLWGECISGALKEDEIIDLSRTAGLYGMHIEKRYVYREVDGYRFYSVTLKGYKAGSSSGTGEYTVIYNGPFSSVTDDDGNTYKAGGAVKVDKALAKKLNGAPFAGTVSVIDADGKIVEPVSSDKVTIKGSGGSCC